MATKKISAMTAATSLTGDEQVPIVQGGVNKSTTSAMLVGEHENQLRMLNSMGSVAIAITIPIYALASSQTFVDGRQYMMPIYLHKASTITGVKFLQTTQGNYTADNNNRIGLYTITTGILTLVASCANDGDLWKGATSSLVTKAFSASYSAIAGFYYIGYLYNNSAQTTAPAISAANFTGGTGSAALDFTNGLFYSSYKATADLVPDTTNINTFSPAGTLPFFMLY